VFAWTLATGPLNDARREAGRKCARVLGDRLGGELRIDEMPSYQALRTHVLERRADFAWLPPALYVQAEAEVDLLSCGVRALHAFFHGALFCRTDSKCESIESLRNQTVAWVDRSSTSGFLFVRYNLDEFVEVDGFFEEERFLGDHAEVVRAVLDGEVAAGATYCHLGEEGRSHGVDWRAEAPPRLVSSAGWGDAEVRVLLISEPIPADVIVSGRTTPDADRIRFVEVLQSLHDTLDGQAALIEFFGVDRFEPGMWSRYSTVRAALAEHVRRSTLPAAP
jgi:ABC-type phosphate/phosphonate transport system substrate-binding protein